MREYIIYADESDKEGSRYSNFYGGGLVRSMDLKTVIDVLEGRKAELGFTREVKWSKVSPQYLDRYVALMDTFFDLIQADLVKVRIMFSDNARVAEGLSKEQVEHEYFILYYYFVKEAFGLAHSNSSGERLAVRIYLDQLPDKKEKVRRFKEFLAGLSNHDQFRNAGVVFPESQIAEVRSHDHVILQCVDVVLGSMQFRLNDKHLVKPEGSRFRGKKTRAKEKLYKHVNARIRRIYPGFNIGISTGIDDITDRWNHPYRHWCFVPKSYSLDPSVWKRRK